MNELTQAIIDVPPPTFQSPLEPEAPMAWLGPEGYTEALGSMEAVDGANIREHVDKQLKAFAKNFSAVTMRQSWLGGNAAYLLPFLL